MNKNIVATTKTVITCVIGGAGFIGRKVVDSLLSHNRKVLVLGRSPLKFPLPTGVDYFQFSKADETGLQLKEILSTVDEIIDLAYATVPQTSFQDPVNDILGNLPSAVRLFELACSLSIDKFVWVSSGGTVYGRSNSDIINEAHQTFPLSPYGITKLAIEKYAHMYFENRGLPIVCVRPSNAFGEGQLPYTGQGFIATAIASIIDYRQINLFGEQGSIRDYLHVTDMANGIVQAMLYGVSGEIYNIGSGIGFSTLQVLEKLKPLAAQIGNSLKINILQPRPFDVPVNVLDCIKLRQDTGWQPNMLFDEALEQTWNWYVKQASI